MTTYRFPGCAVHTASRQYPRKLRVLIRLHRLCASSLCRRVRSMPTTLVLLQCRRLVHMCIAAMVLLRWWGTEALQVCYQVEQLTHGEQIHVLCGHNREAVSRCISWPEHHHGVRVENGLGEIRCRMLRPHPCQIRARRALGRGNGWKLLTSNHVTGMASQINKSLATAGRISLRQCELPARWYPAMTV
jgi:hypothetical protein